MSRFSIFLLIFLFLYQNHSTLAGCYQKKLCCRGRNNTCRAIDDGIDHLPTISPIANMNREQGKGGIADKLAQYQVPYYKSTENGFDFVYPAVVDVDSREKIGKLVMPDVVELDGSSAEDIYNKYGRTRDDEEGPAQLVQKARTTPAPKITHFLFGKHVNVDDNPPEELVHQNTRPHHMLLRYSVLARHLPLKITGAAASSSSSGEFHGDNKDNTYSIQYLEAAPIDCYCDEACIELGDCCSDYTFMCPPKDCEVSEWQNWQACKPDKGHCGTGVQQRDRQITQDREGGGAQCPPLKEMRTCFKECPRKNLSDLTTVALLLDYKHNTTRKSLKKPRSYLSRQQAEKLKTAQYYCVTYEIGWVNRNCLNRQIRSRLFKGTTICAECQPEAQLHRNTPRCASDLEDGDEGFWKLIGPKSCNGIWRRLNRTEDCRCSRDIPKFSPFLLV